MCCVNVYKQRIVAKIYRPKTADVRQHVCIIVWPIHSIMCKYDAIHKQNRKYKTYRIVVREGPSYGHSTYWKFRKIWTCGFRDMQALNGQTDRQTKRETNKQINKQTYHTIYNRPTYLYLCCGYDHTCKSVSLWQRGWSGQTRDPLHHTDSPVTTLCPKKTLLWLAVTSTYMNQFWSLLAGLLQRADSQTMIYFPLHQSNASALPGKTRKHENRIFSLKYCIAALPEFSQSLFDFVNFVDLQIIITLL